MREISLEPSWRSRLEALSGGTRAAWLTALVAAATVGAGFLLSRPPPAEIAPPTRSDDPAPTVLVHVAGAVRRPGLYELPPDARVADAVEAARGPRRGAELHALNLAAPVVDGQRIEVPQRAADVGSAVAPGEAAPSPSGATVNVNTADAATLEAIPGIGPVKAGAIVAHREEHGPFPTLEALLEVSGIGPATLEQMRPYVTL